MWSLSAQFELARSGDSPNLRSMEGMRGFAVFLVFLTHFVTLYSPWVTKGSPLAMLAETLHTVGNVGVDLFFVLSGYLIYRSIIGRSQHFVRFFRRRIARIYPAFLAVFALYLIISFVRPTESKIVGSGWDAWVYVLENLLLLPGLFPIVPVITVAWSLSYEMMYYLAIPILVALFAMRQRSRRWRVLFFVATAELIAWY
jgi:peptidoglycan/LPS O-acetylase OafA/YrhL